MPSTEIPRIAMPGADAFYRQYVYTRTPVVVTNLFEGQEVSRIATREDAERAWGPMKIHLD